MTPYADSNFYTRIYLPLPQSVEADLLLRSARESDTSRLPLTWLHHVEIVNAFQLHVFQGHDSGQSYVSSRQAALAYRNFRADEEKSDFLRPAAIPIEELAEKVEEMSLRRTARHGFRAYDLLHVASALVIGCDTFWSFDRKATLLAKLEGLKVRRA